MEKRWTYKSLPTTDEEKALIDDLSKSLNINSFLTTLLWQRGLSDFDTARNYFRPSIAHLHNPFLMKDMDKAVERLQNAIQKGEKIMVYGDYDVDGTTSVTMFYSFLQNHYSNITFYIPDRYKEGYGVSRTGVEVARDLDCKLIVTLDCGIKSIELVKEAKQWDIDFIICDHHRPGDEIPNAVAVLDPKRIDCQYPFKELTGCGVGFKLLQAYCQTNGIDEQTELFPYMDLLVVSIAADIVPIVGENRVLSFFGLKQLNTAPRMGLKALKDIAGFQGEMDISNVVFGLGPRINAAGRIKHAHDAVKLLLVDNDTDAFDFAAEINKHNLDRRGHDTRITQEALAMIEEDEWLRNAKTTVLFKPDWHKGVIGIVASRCIEKYHRPTIILTQSEKKIAGSARSVPGFDLYDAIEACSELLEQFGGHTFAAGLTMYEENLKAFQQKFESIVSQRILPEQLSPLIEADMKLPLKQITERFYNIINQMQPFGPGNMIPAFISQNVRLRGYPRILKEKHLKIEVCQDDSPVLTGIGFGMAGFYEQLMEGQPFHICYHIEMNEFQGKRSLQLHLKDIKFGELKEY